MGIGVGTGVGTGVGILVGAGIGGGVGVVGGAMEFKVKVEKYASPMSTTVVTSKVSPLSEAGDERVIFTLDLGSLEPCPIPAALFNVQAPTPEASGSVVVNHFEVSVPGL